MIKRLVAAAGAAILSVLVVAGGASAAGRAAGCAGSFDSPGDECSFAYGGGGVYVSMSIVSDPLGAGVVRLEKVGALGRRQVVLSCVAGGAWGGCATSYAGDDVADLDAPLYCVVESRGGSGLFGCGSQATTSTVK